MADNVTIARPYARALFSESLSSGTFDDWQMSVDAFAIIVSELSRLQVIGNPTVSQKQLFSLCFDSIKQVVTVQSDFEAQLKNFVELILQEDRLETVPQIAALYHQLVNKHNRIVEAEVISAQVLSDEQRQELVTSLERRFNSKVIAQYSEDASLIGGLIVKSDGWVFDGTIRSKLTRLAERII